MLRKDRSIIINYRLSPLELNAVIYKMAAQHDPNLDSDISSLSFSNFINGKSLALHNAKRTLHIFPMCKDAQSPENETSLNYIGDTIKKFCETLPEKKGLMLIPMRMCRGYLRLPIKVPCAQRKHAVLVLVDLDDMHIEVLDSQGWLRKKLYPDKFEDKAGQITLGEYKFHYNPQEHYHPFGVQEKFIWNEDVVACGFYVLAYAQHIMHTNDVKGCEKIKLSVTNAYKNKWEYLQKFGIHISSPPLEKRTSEIDYEDKLGFVFLGTPPIPIDRQPEEDIILPFEISNDEDLKFNVGNAAKKQLTL